MSFLRSISLLFVGFGLSSLIILCLIICWLALNMSFVPSKPPEEEGYPTWSPDGKRIAFVCYLDGPTRAVMESDRRQYDAAAADICIAGEDGTNRIRLTVNEVADFSPIWSPDGTRIAYISRNGIYIIHDDGNHQRQLVDTSNIRHVYELDLITWSPNGKYLAFSACLNSQDRDIYIVNIDNGELTNLTSGNVALDESPVWLPDSKRIIFLSSPSSVENCLSIPGSKSSVKRINIDGTGQTNIFDIETFYGSVAISTLTDYIAFTANIEAKNDTESLIFDPYLFTMRLDEDKPTSWGKIGGFLAWSPDGRYLAYASSSNKVILLDPQTGNQRELPATFSPDSFLAWSPDSQKLATTVTEKVDGLIFVHRILIIDLNSNSVHPLIQR